MAQRTSGSPWVKGIRFALGRSAVHGCHPRRRAQCARRWHRGRDRCHKFTATQQVHLDWLRSRIELGGPPSLVVATGAGLTLIRVAVKAATPRTAKVRRVTYYGHAGDAHKAPAFRPSRPVAAAQVCADQPLTSMPQGGQPTWVPRMAPIRTNASIDPRRSACMGRSRQKKGMKWPSSDRHGW